MRTGCECYRNLTHVNLCTQWRDLRAGFKALAGSSPTLASTKFQHVLAKCGIHTTPESVASLASRFIAPNGEVAYDAFLKHFLHSVTSSRRAQPVSPAEPSI